MKNSIATLNTLAKRYGNACNLFLRIHSAACSYQAMKLNQDCSTGKPRKPDPDQPTLPPAANTSFGHKGAQKALLRSIVAKAILNLFEYSLSAWQHLLIKYASKCGVMGLASGQRTFDVAFIYTEIAVLLVL